MFGFQFRVFEWSGKIEFASFWSVHGGNEWDWSWSLSWQIWRLKIHGSKICKIDLLIAETDRTFCEWFEIFGFIHFFTHSSQDNNETFAVDVSQITAETKSDLDELIKKTVSKNDI